MKLSSDKKMLQKIIIAGALGLGFILVLIFVLLFMGKGGEERGPLSQNSLETTGKTMRSVGQILTLSEALGRVKAYDIDEEKEVDLILKENTIYEDEYGNTLTIKEFRKGDLVNLRYDSETLHVALIKKIASSTDFSRSKKLCGKIRRENNTNREWVLYL